jgi:hypothetical protein
MYHQDQESRYVGAMLVDIESVPRECDPRPVGFCRYSRPAKQVSKTTTGGRETLGRRLVLPSGEVESIQFLFRISIE